MLTYTPPLKEILFLLNAVFKEEAFGKNGALVEVAPDLVEEILGEGGRFCTEKLLPCAEKGDSEGCHFDKETGAVSTPEGFKELYQEYTEAGWDTLSVSTDYGGQGLPHTLSFLLAEFSSATNISFGVYVLLTRGAVLALERHGTPEQKAFFLPPMVTGRWAGTMNLTEAQCGTDLGLLTTKALPQEDGSYRLTGTKIFISSGDHDLTENIIHLVLARIEGAPEGVKGISMFIVPKFLPTAEGKCGARNAVYCEGIEEKMGIHASSTCTLRYEAATGWLLGAPHKGLQAMFTMMNSARLQVGIQGLALSDIAYQNARDYACTRRQGRALTGEQDKESPADLLIVHPDIRRMLLTLRSVNEASRALYVWVALHSDRAERAESETVRAESARLVMLMTPILKGFLTDRAFDNTVLAQQILGGYGYIRDFGIERLVRDARVTMIYEGTNGVQALDLVGRKLPKDGGQALTAFMTLVATCLKETAEIPEIAPLVAPLRHAYADLEKANQWLLQHAFQDKNSVGSAATAYMHLLGLVALGFMWALLLQTAQEEAKAGRYSTDFLNQKRAVGQFFMQWILPETGLLLTRISAGPTPLMTLDPTQF